MSSDGDLVNVKGLSDLAKALDTLPAKIQNNLMRGALRAGAKLVMAEAQHTAAFADRTGALRASLRIGTKLTKTGVMANVSAGKGKKGKDGKKATAAFYARFIEYGTKPHEIRAKKGGLLAIGVSHVHHPGITPRPFLRPALDVTAPAAVQASAQYLRNKLATKHGIDVPEPLVEGDE